MANVEKVVLKYVKSNADIKPEVFDIAMGTDLEEDKVELALQSLLKQGLVVEKTNERGKSSWLPGSGKPAAPPPPPPAPAPVASPVADGIASEAGDSRPAPAKPAKPARAARVEADEDVDGGSEGGKPWIWAIGSILVSTMLAVGIAMTMIGGQYVPKTELDTIKAREEVMKSELVTRIYTLEKAIKKMDEEKAKAAKAAEEAAKAKPAAKSKKKGRR